MERKYLPVEWSGKCLVDSKQLDIIFDFTNIPDNEIEQRKVDLEEHIGIITDEQKINRLET